MLATNYNPDPNPVSATSLFVLTVCVVAAFGLSRQGNANTRERQAWAASAALFSTAFGYLMLILMRYPDTGMLAGACTAIAFGFGYAISAFRGPSRPAAWLAYLASLASLFLITTFFFGGLSTVLYEYASNRDELTNITTLTALCIVMLSWLVFGFILMRRRRLAAYNALHLDAGRCPTCTYDLRGSVGQASCPECGARIPWDRVTLPVA
ncbi:hypothetical protein OT109_05135 [Phycisphaeraceae bacterium D3-23]